MKKIELLAPAGNMECLKAAINAGADAVYLGGKLFGAREFASNFDNDEIIETINYSHLYGVKVYVTVNTIIYEHEVERFLNFVDFLVKNNVDALIIQDIGMMDLLRRIYPRLELHASTQMHIHNLKGAKIIEKLGLKRAVIARETSIEAIKEIKQNTNIELEVFIHGALCVSYSGQCLMSSLIGSRSGNRGTCAQCCRMEYDLIENNKKVNKDKYLLSTKDLYTLNNIGHIIESGATSLKIEGRMKRKEYVYLVTSIYRKAIDEYMNKGTVNISDKDFNDLKLIFNRYFTKGFLFNEKNNDFVNQYRPNHMGLEIGKVIEINKNKVKIKLTQSLNLLDGIRILSREDIGFTVNKMYMNGKQIDNAKKGDIIELYIESNNKVSINDTVIKTTDKKQLDTIDNILNKVSRKVKISGTLYCYKNKNLKLEITDGYNNIEVTSNYIVEKALSKNMEVNRIKEQLNKLGNTIYEFKDLNIIGDTDIFINIKDLNEIRRQAIELLNQKRLYKKEYERKEYDLTLNEIKENKGFNILIHNLEDYEKIKNKDYKEIYIDDKNIKDSLNDERLVLKLKRVINKHECYQEKLLIGEMGSLNYKDFITDFSFNVVNSYSVAFLQSMGAKRVTLSYELNDKQIENIIEGFKNRYKINPNLELIVSSYPEAMISKFDLLKYYNIKDNAYLKDKFNNLFLIKSNDEFMTIYHYNKIKLDDYEKYFNMGINTLRIHMD